MFSLIPETLFDPLKIGKDYEPIQNIINSSLNNIDINLRKDFIQNMVLGGGNSTIKGFQDKLKKTLVETLSKNNAGFIKINAQNERKYSAWIGASVVCSIGNFQEMWISKNDYEEVGPQILHKKSYI